MLCLVIGALRRLSPVPEADGDAVADQVVLTHALERDDVLDPRLGGGRTGDDGHGREGQAGENGAEK